MSSKVKVDVKKACLYLRFSDAKQIGNTSIASQEEVCTRYCDTQGYEITDIIRDEATSANSTNERRILELLSFCKEHKGTFEILVVFKLDRFARSTDQHIWLRSRLRELGIILRSATEPIDESKEGKLMETILSAFAEFDNSVKKERVKLAMWQRVNEGLFPWNPPLGYMVDPKRPEGVRLTPHVIDPKKASMVKRIFADYSTGAFSKPSLGTKYNLSKQRLDGILRNPYFMGHLKTQDGQLVRGKHEALISIDLFYKCQEIKQGLSNNATKPRLFLNPDFPLRGLIVCSACGKNLTACHPKKPTFTKYYCFNKGCKLYSRSIDGKDIEDDFWELLRTVKPTKTTEEKITQKLIVGYEKRKDEFKTDYMRQMETIAKLQAEQNWVVTQGRRGDLPEHLVKDQVKELEGQIMAEKKKLNGIYIKEVDIAALLSHAFSFIRTLENSWYEAKFEAKLTIQRLVFKRRIAYDVVSRQFGLLEPSISPLFRLDKKESEQRLSTLELIDIISDLRMWQELSGYSNILVERTRTATV